jgi:hypothetical protein
MVLYSNFPDFILPALHSERGGDILGSKLNRGFPEGFQRTFPILVPDLAFKNSLSFEKLTHPATPDLSFTANHAALYLIDDLQRCGRFRCLGSEMRKPTHRDGDSQGMAGMNQD